MKNIIWLIIIITSALVLSAVILVVEFTLFTKDDDSSYENSTHWNDTSSEDYQNDDAKISRSEIIPRDVWGAPALAGSERTEIPIEYVVVMHTAGRYCRKRDDCQYVVQKVREGTMKDLNYPEIKYNFLIGGDGNVYEGLGWNFKTDDYRSDTISIALIGNFVFEVFHENIRSALEEFLAAGLAEGHLSEDYVLVPHNETATTLSPGPNVYRVIKEWEHFARGDRLIKFGHRVVLDEVNRKRVK